jgi:phosphoribosylanthranilate isomerase
MNEFMWKNFIQIAGVKSLDEARTLINEGVGFIGFPLRLTVNAEDISEEEAKAIIAEIKNEAKPVLITYLSEHGEIAEFADYIDVKIVQLHGEITEDELASLKAIKPELKIIKSLVVRENNLSDLLVSVEKLSPFVDAFITDTFDPKTGAEGATGKTHDWNVSAKLREKSSKPLILAGGLTPENVAEAIRAVMPAGVDAHTGVEDENGDKSSEKVKAFVQNAMRAFDEIN